jgi:hypothetical protein
MHKYLYRFDHWGKDEWSEWTTDEGYHAAAESICEEYDNETQDFPDQRILILRDVEHNTPRNFAVYSETSRIYDAHEQETE